MITFGEFLPDQSDFGNAGVTVANNVIPAIGYMRVCGTYLF